MVVGVKRVLAKWSLAINELTAMVFGIELGHNGLLPKSLVYLEGGILNVMKGISNKLLGCSSYFPLLVRLHYLLHFKRVWFVKMAISLHI